MRERPHSSRAVEQSSADSFERRLNERQSLQNTVLGNGYADDGF